MTTDTNATWQIFCNSAELNTWVFVIEKRGWGGVDLPTGRTQKFLFLTERTKTDKQTRRAKSYAFRARGYRKRGGKGLEKVWKVGEGRGGYQAYLDVVAPPISRGILRPCLSISLATWIISSSDGVINPDNPIMSAFSLIAVWRIFSHGVITPRSITLQTNDKEKSRACNNPYTHQRPARLTFSRDYPLLSRI